MEMNRPFHTLVALAASLLATAAYAVPITGSFSGIASGHRGCYHVPCATFENEPASGTFSFDIDPSRPLNRDDEFGYAYGFGWPITLTFDVLGEHVVFESPTDDYTSFIGMPSDGTYLTLSFYGPRADPTEVVLGALPGRRLFTNFDLATFDASAVAIAASGAHFSRDLRSENTYIALRRLSLDNGPDLVVPEPQPSALFAVGLLLLGMSTGFKRLGRRL